MTTLLDARIRDWRNELVAQGIAEGQARGIERGRLQGLEQGIERGIERGIEQARADERALLCRQARRRFDTETAQRLADLLEGLGIKWRTVLEGLALMEAEALRTVRVRDRG